MRLVQWQLLFLVFLSDLAVLPAQDATVDTLQGDALVAEYFRLETQRLADQTDAILSGVKTVAEWEAEKPELRRQLFEMLGLDPLPPKTDLKPTVTGKTEHEEFTVERLHFQSSPGLYVTGNLYLPKHATGPLPTVLYVCGHSRNVKNGIAYGNKVGYQHHGGWYARNGYACLTIDTLQLGEIEGLHHGTYKEGMWWWHARGYTPAGVEAWNCIRALDYLETRPEVDKTRIGVTGRSGGGAYSWWIAALDERIKVAVPVAGITSLKNHVVDGCIEGHCDCMFQVNTYGWDYALVAALVAPRPLLIANTDKDGIFPLDGVVDVHRKVRRIYDLYGKPRNLGLNITEGPHEDTQELQTHEFVWFNRFLKQSESPIDKVAVKFFEPEQLKVFETLPADQRNTRIQEEFVPVQKHAVPKTVAEWEAMWDGWEQSLESQCFLAWPFEECQQALDVKELNANSRREIQWTEYEYLSQEPYRLSLLVTSPGVLDRAKAERVIVHVLDQPEWDRIHGLITMGRSEAEFKLDAVRGLEFIAFQNQCRAAGTVHCYVSPRGVGPTEWTRDERKRTHIRRRFALLGQTDDSARVWDVRRAIQAVRSIPQLKEQTIALSASGQAAGWALYASLFEAPLAGLELTDLPPTHREGPIFLNVSRLLEMPQAVAIASERSHVTLRFTQPVDKSDWEFATAVDALLGKREHAGLTVVNKSGEE